MSPLCQKLVATNVTSLAPHKMVISHNIAELVQQNYFLLTDNNDSLNKQLTEEVGKDEREHINHIIDESKDEEGQEKA